MDDVLNSSSLDSEFKTHFMQFVKKVEVVFSEGDNDFLTHMVGYKFMKKGEYILICRETHRPDGDVVEQSYCAINVKKGGIHNAITHNIYTKSSVANIHNPDSYAHADDGHWLSQLHRGKTIVVMK